MQETWVHSLGWEDPLEKGTATHSSILAWRIPWTVHGVAKSRTRLSDSLSQKEKLRHKMAPGQGGGKNRIYSQVSVTVSKRMCSFSHSGVLRVSEIRNTWKATPDTFLYLSLERMWWGWRKEPHENEQGTWGLHAPGWSPGLLWGCRAPGGLMPPFMCPQWTASWGWTRWPR